MQLIVCPSSMIHTWESLVSPFYKPLENFYEILSCGIHFYDPYAIEPFQIIEHARNWIRGEPDKPLTLDLETAVESDINVWPPRFDIKLSLGFDPAFIDQLREWRSQVHKGLAQVFQGWQTESHRSFDDWFVEQAAAFGKTALQDVGTMAW